MEAEFVLRRSCGTCRDVGSAGSDERLRVA